MFEKASESNIFLALLSSTVYEQERFKELVKNRTHQCSLSLSLPCKTKPCLLQDYLFKLRFEQNTVKNHKIPQHKAREKQTKWLNKRIKTNLQFCRRESVVELEPIKFQHSTGNCCVHSHEIEQACVLERGLYLYGQ